MNQSIEDIKRQKNPKSTACRICNVPAIYSHFGVISCDSCKVFFKRNAQRYQEKAFQCNYNDQCEINIHNRHVCKSCRLKKCFKTGMQIDLFRSKLSSKRRTSKLSIKSNESALLTTINLLRSNQSTLTIDEYNHISNLIHYYDDYSGVILGEKYMNEQLNLPLKSRFKSASLIDFTQKTIEQARILYQNNQDFLSLSPNDRSILLHMNIKYTAGLSGNFIYHSIGLTGHSTYYDTLSQIANPNVVLSIKCLIKRIGFDFDAIKLFLAILTFSTANFTVYTNSSAKNISNIKQILNIQNLYIDLTWKYFIYKYNYQQTIKFFSNFIQCIFALQDAIAYAEDVQWYTNTIDFVTKETEQNLLLND